MLYFPRHSVPGRLLHRNKQTSTLGKHGKHKVGVINFYQRASATFHYSVVSSAGIQPLHHDKTQRARHCTGHDQCLSSNIHHCNTARGRRRPLFSTPAYYLFFRHEGQQVEREAHGGVQLKRRRARENPDSTGAKNIRTSKSAHERSRPLLDRQISSNIHSVHLSGHNDAENARAFVLHLHYDRMITSTPSQRCTTDCNGTSAFTRDRTDRRPFASIFLQRSTATGSSTYRTP